MTLRLERLRHDMDVKRALKSKRGAFDPVCGIKMVPNNLSYNRFAFVTGTKVSKLAVERNRLRRQYRELIREFLPSLLPGHDVVLLVSKSALPLSYADKRTKLQGTLRRARLLAPSAAPSSRVSHPALPKDAVV